MEAGVVAPEAGVGVDAENSRQNLRSQEEKNGKVEGGAADGDFFGCDPLEDPSGSNEDGQDIDEEHFVELKDLGGTRPKDQRNEKEKDAEEEFDGFVGEAGEL